MTRINAISPQHLSNKHLVAEYRELPRVFGLVRKAQDRGEQPYAYRYFDRYVLGEGHVKFFYTRLRYLVRRHDEILKEMRQRGYQPQYSEPKTDEIGPQWFGDWLPRDEDIKTNMARLIERDAEHYGELK